MLTRLGHSVDAVKVAMAFWRAPCIAVLAVAMVACGSSPPAPVEDRNRRTPGDGREYVVQRGDTLYSIAFRYGLDYRRVAAANSIPAPYTIYPGQRVTLRESEVAAPSKAKATAAPAPLKPAPAKPPVTKPSQPASKTVSPPPQPVYTGAKVSTWRWPAEGRVTRGFSASVHKGIDIDGKRGNPVVAAAAGKVVYAGTGIVGLGELLIVKHNEVYLSAYAHNDALLVSEGDVVKSGQLIARQGSSGTSTVQLHFEIRREGKPIDPQKLLPKR